MNSHKNAALTPRGRAHLIERIELVGLMPAAEAAGISARTARKWQARHAQEGAAGLLDRSSRPRSSPRRSDEYLIQTPLFDVMSAEGSRWKGQSKLGRLDVSKDRLWLQEDVVLDGTRPKREPVKIRSQRIEFAIDEKLASSDEAVEIVSTGSEIRGVGLRADLDKDRFVLLKQVEGEYVPKRKGS